MQDRGDQQVIPCAVLGCGNMLTNLRCGQTFYFFPNYRKFPLEYARWVEACGYPESLNPGRGGAVCSDHFIASDFELKQNRYRLKYGALPRQSPTSKSDKTDVTDNELRESQTRVDLGDSQDNVSTTAILKEVNTINNPILPATLDKTNDTKLLSDVNDSSTHPASDSAVKPMKTYSKAGQKVIPTKELVSDKENYYKVITRHVIKLPTSDDPFSEETLRRFRNLADFNQRKTEKLKAVSPSVLIEKFKAADSFEVTPISEHSHETAHNKTDFSVLLEPSEKKIYQTFAEYRTRSDDDKWHYKLSSFIDSASTASIQPKLAPSMAVIGGSLQSKKSQAVWEPLSELEIDLTETAPTSSIVPESTYIQALKALNTTVIPVDTANSSSRSSRTPKPTNYSVTMRPVMVRKFTKISFPEEGVQCEIGLEKYRTALKLGEIREREEACDKRVITYDLPNDHREQKVQCEMGVEALSKIKNFDSFMHHLEQNKKRSERKRSQISEMKDVISFQVN